MSIFNSSALSKATLREKSNFLTYSVKTLWTYIDMSIVFNNISRRICTILVNRPQKRNALDLETIRNLRQAVERFDNDNTLDVAILGGVGNNFCAGYDLNEIVDSKSKMPNIQQIEQMLWPIGFKLSNKKIVIAAIEGHAAGFGYELALKCDFRIADKDSRLGFMNRRFGVPILNGGTVILPQLIGLARAMELIASGKAQLAPEALQQGVITYIADVGCALGRSLNLARCLVKFDQMALLHDLKSSESSIFSRNFESLRKERADSLKYLQTCGTLEVACRFLKGELGRHGNYDLGNSIGVQPEVTL